MINNKPYVYVRIVPDKMVKTIPTVKESKHDEWWIRKNYGVDILDKLKKEVRVFVGKSAFLENSILAEREKNAEEKEIEKTETAKT